MATRFFSGMTLLMLTLLLSAPPACARGGAVELTLQDAIDLAMKDGYEARSFRLDLLKAEQTMAAVRGHSRTRVNLILNAPDFAEQVQDVRLPDQLPSYNTTGRMDWNGSLSITQPVPFTNSQFTLQSTFQRRRETVFNDILDTNDKAKRFLSDLRISFRQVLLTPNTQKLDLESARLRLEEAKRTFTRDQLDIVYNTTRSFYDFYSAVRSLEIAHDNLTQQEQLYNLALKKYEAGLIPEVEALQMQVDLAQSRNQLLEAEGERARQADAFKLAIGLELTDSVSVRADFTLHPFEVDVAKAVGYGLRNRAEIRETEITRRLAEITLRQTDARTAIRGEFNAYYDRTGVSDPFLPYDTGTGDLFNSSWKDLKRRPRNLGVTFTLTVPLWDSGANGAEVAAARATLDRSALTVEQRRRQVEAQIRSAVNRLYETRNRVDVLKKSEDVAQRGYEISLSRFENGDITSQDLALTRDRLTTARQGYLNAYIQYQLAVADLKRQTLYDFEADRSLTEEVR